MPLALIVALAASLGVHALALFVPDVDLSAVPEQPALTAELQPLPKPTVLPSEASSKLQRKAPKPKQKPPPANATPTMSAPEPAEQAIFAAAPELIPPAVLDALEEAVPQPLAAESRMPAHGKIHFRVDWGDQGFELGRSTHEWELVGERYRITAVTETSGLAAFFKPMRVELESQGRLTGEGLQPEHFTIRRNGKLGGEQADFDWAQMQIKIGGSDSNAVTQTLTHGAQDLLSFNYQFGFLPQLATDNSLPIATGKKYTTYLLEVLGDEEIEIPAGTFHTLHLRAPGDNTTELWLAYDYLLLPVKIRHLDRRGDSFVQVATEIQLSKEASPR